MRNTIWMFKSHGKQSFPLVQASVLQWWAACSYWRITILLGAALASSVFKNFHFNLWKYLRKKAQWRIRHCHRGRWQAATEVLLSALTESALYKQNSYALFDVAVVLESLAAHITYLLPNRFVDHSLYKMGKALLLLKLSEIWLGGSYNGSAHLLSVHFERVLVIFKCLSSPSAGRSWYF